MALRDVGLGGGGISLELSVTGDAGVADVRSLLDARVRAVNRHVIAAIRRVVRTHGLLTKELTQLFSPVDTGHMQQSVKTVFHDNGTAFETGWSADDFPGSFYPFFQEFGTVKMKAQPSLGPAMTIVAPQFRADLAAAVNEALQRE